MVYSHLKRGVFVTVIVAAAILSTGCAEEFIYTTEDRYILTSGETVRGDLQVGTSLVVLEEGTLVTGNVTVPAGHLVANGEIGGDVYVPAGDVTLGSTALLRGDLNLGAGALNRAEGAVIEGRIIQAPDS